MKRTILLSALAVVVSAAVSALPGCSEDCGCAPAPDLPEPQSALPIVEAATYDETGDSAPLAVDPRGGTLTIDGPTVVIRYTEADGEHEVRYVVDNGA